LNSSGFHLAKNNFAQINRKTNIATVGRTPKVVSLKIFRIPSTKFSPLQSVGTSTFIIDSHFGAIFSIKVVSLVLAKAIRE
jgi:hypothetical protein